MDYPDEEEEDAIFWPPCCEHCEETDREDCGPDCEKAAKYFKEPEEEPLGREDRGLDERWEREI